jgi:hypothetical protein
MADQTAKERIKKLTDAANELTVDSNIPIRYNQLKYNVNPHVS